MPLRRLAAAIVGLLPLLAAGTPWRAHEGNSPDWRDLTPAERVAHQHQLRRVGSLAACKAYLARHHALIAERARRAGQAGSPPQPDTCDRLQQEGRLP